MMQGIFGLDVAELVDAVVEELKQPHAGGVQF